jgi:hypothetical protein
VGYQKREAVHEKHDGQHNAEQLGQLWRRQD